MSRWTQEMIESLPSSFEVLFIFVLLAPIFGHAKIRTACSNCIVKPAGVIRNPCAGLLWKITSLKTTIAFDECNRNVTRMLWLLMKYEGITLGPSSQFTANDFVKEWKSGGKKFLEQHWRDPANTPTKTLAINDSELDDMTDATDDADDDTEDAKRELFQGKHEWIPTNMLGYIVEKAIIKYNDIKWVYIAETLRTPTRIVVVKPSKMRKNDTVNPIGLTGHVGALYTSSNNTPLFKGQATFHNELRAILKAHLSDTANNFNNYKNTLMDHIRDWYWQGVTTDLAPTGCNANLSLVPCPYKYNSGQSEYTSWGATMADMASTLREQWTFQNQYLLNIFASSLTLQPEQKQTGVYFSPRG
jgi:hypothetical protein